MKLLLAKNDPQGQGSAITYARRYALMAMLALVADEDDDANAASKPRQAKLVAEAKTPAAPVVTAGQRETIYAKVKDLGLSTSKAKEAIQKAAGVGDSKKIPTDKYDAVLAALDEIAVS